MFASYVIYYIKQTKKIIASSMMCLLVMLFIILSKLKKIIASSMMCLLVMLFIILSKPYSEKHNLFNLFASYVIYYIKQTL